MSIAYEAAAAKLAPSPKSLDELRLFTMPESGTDELTFLTWDTIEVPGFGEDTVELTGHYRIEREDPTSADWQEASVTIHMRELALTGTSEKFGRLTASVNDDIGKESRGEVKAGTTYPGIADSPKMCVMEGYMKFELPDIGITVFNKEPIVLQHTITHIPPIGQGGGTRGRVAVNLYADAAESTAPLAILRQVKTHIGAWRSLEAAALN
jgi:Family of unknown function (DUF6073)